MSSSDVVEQPAAALAQAAEALAGALADPDRIADADLRVLLANAVRLYAAKAENGMRNPLPGDAGGVTITDVMLLTTDLLHKLNVQLFELSMWQAMTGNCIAPHQRVDALEAERQNSAD
jgi:hypothetical protein